MLINILAVFIVLNFERVFASGNFRILPEHVFNLDVALICQPFSERLNLNAIVSIWEYDIISNDDFLGKVVISGGKHFEFLFRHAEFGEVKPYMVIYHDCNPKVNSKCYAKTEYHFEEPKTLGETVFLQIDLLRQSTDIICDKGYPFGRLPPPNLKEPKIQQQFKGNTTILPTSNKTSISHTNG